MKKVRLEKEKLRQEKQVAEKKVIVQIEHPQLLSRIEALSREKNTLQGSLTNLQTQFKSKTSEYQSLVNANTELQSNVDRMNEERKRVIEKEKKLREHYAKVGLTNEKLNYENRTLERRVEESKQVKN